MVDSIVAELHQKLQSDPWQQWPIQTIYFGGGTPSLLSEKSLTAIMAAVGSKDLSTIEVTLEANPEDIDDVRLGFWKAIGINRLSIGVQSFNDETLRWMHRSHSAEVSKEVVWKAFNHDFRISVDLIYGNPNQTEENWRSTLLEAFELPVVHLSCYMLTVEPQTALYHQVQNSKVLLASDEVVAQQYQILQQEIDNRKWEAYEVSNYCKSGFRAVHNSNYWNHSPYLGVGPSAYSFDGSNRFHNIANNQKYIANLKSELPISEKEPLNRKDIFNEKVMLGLRTSEGVHLESLESLDLDLYNIFYSQLEQEMIGNDQLVLSEKHLTIARSAKIWSDRITSDLFLD